jgi:excisionase family DNA binding protein
MAQPMPVEGPAPSILGRDDQFLATIQREASAEARRLGSPFVTVDIFFAVFLRHFAHFGYFTFGPITVDVRLISDIVDRTAERVGAATHVYSDDFVRFSSVLSEEVRRSGHSHLDELHMLLAFMRCGEGLPGRVFSELGVTPAQVESYARSAAAGHTAPTPEKLYSPEEAADYLGVHVQTVRAWIRSGKLRASRLTGQRALRIAASDLQSVLEPVESDQDLN